MLAFFFLSFFFFKIWRGGGGGGGGEEGFLLHIPFYTSHFYLGSLSDIYHAGFIFMWGVSLTHPMLALFLSGEFLLHIPCLLCLSVGSFSYTPHAGFFICLIWGVSLTQPRLASFLSGEFLLHIPCWRFLFLFFLFFYLGSFSYTSRAAFILIWEGSLTHPVQASFLSREILLHISCLLYSSVGSFSYTSHVGFFFVFIWGVFLTHPAIASFLYGEFLLHTPLVFCVFFFFFYLGRFSYTYRAGFIFFISGVSLILPGVLHSFLCREFLLHIPYWLHFMHGVFLSYPLLASFLSREILLHILC